MKIKRLTKLIASVLLSVSILCGATPVYEVTVPDNNDIEVVASYEKIYRTVRYYVTNTQYKDVSVEWGTNALDPRYINQVNPAFSGYTFYGWTESPTAVSGANTPSKINAKEITQNAVLYAIFSKEVSVTFDKGNAQSASLPGTQKQNGFYSNGRYSTLTFSLPQTLSYTYAGYGFRGWSTSSGQSSGVYSYTTTNNTSAKYYAAFAFTPSLSSSPSTMALSIEAGHGDRSRTFPAGWEHDDNGWYSSADSAEGYFDVDVRGLSTITITATVYVYGNTQDEGDTEAGFYIGTAGTDHTSRILKWDSSTYDDKDSYTQGWGSKTYGGYSKTGRNLRYYLLSECGEGNSSSATQTLTLTIPVSSLQGADYIAANTIRIYYGISQYSYPYGGGNCYKMGLYTMSINSVTVR